MATTSIVIEDRYQGFPGIALGGITGGRMADRIGNEAEVVLHRPIPTGRMLEMIETEEGIQLRMEGDLAATAHPTAVDIKIPDPVSWEDAKAASQYYLGHHDHPYPACFTCGHERAEEDGLRVFAGPLENGPMLAAPWTPHPNHATSEGVLPLEYSWAAVDCPSIWAVVEAAAPESTERVVSGRLALRHKAPIRAGEPHVIAAWPLARKGDIWSAAAVIYSGEGDVKAVAHHMLVVTDWGVPLGVSRPNPSK
ncbi:MAG: hypothetical protein GVY12_02445 [Bacteroidetes bacterium]|jgi:hypothetical protein|nr:hypothetical protein [Bacteroidota bacterium]